MVESIELRKAAEMRKVIVEQFLSLDGVAQAPGEAEEDTSSGFQHGGWHMQFMDEPAQQRVLQGIIEAGGFLLGRRTYEIFAGYWPHASEEEQVIAEPLNTKPKYVASTTLTDPLDWQNSTVLGTDLEKEIIQLKEQEGGHLHVSGSTQLVQWLTEHGLVDEYRLMIDPVVVGGGKRLFSDDGALRQLQLVDSLVTPTGAIFATYVPAGA